ALVYAASSLLALWTRAATQALVGLGLLLGYYLVVCFVPVPGTGAWFDLSPAGNLGAWLDRLLLGTHIYRGGPYDPEGLLSTVPAVATGISGVLAGRWVGDARRSPHERVAGLFAAGLALAFAGWVWDSSFPINKSLWTSSYVLFTSGLALQALAV